MRRVGSAAGNGCNSAVRGPERSDGSRKRIREKAGYVNADGHRYCRVRTRSPMENLLLQLESPRSL